MGLAAFAVLATLPGRAAAAAAEMPGAAHFKQFACVGCHTIGGGKLVGPDLKGVTDRRTEDWLKKFIKSSQTVINGGDPVAKALFEEYNKTPMPDAAASEAQIVEIIAYLKAAGGSGAGADSAPAAAAPVPEPTEADVVLGQNLFQGRTRLANGGPSCNSCHDVKNDAIIGGGVLAKELTTVFTRMGGAGVRSILSGAPFPVMEQAYRNKPLTEQEIAALVAFLQRADAQQAFQKPRDYGVMLLGSGAAGAVVLFGIYGFFSRGRKQASVNQEIYDRQIKSE